MSVNSIWDLGFRIADFGVGLDCNIRFGSNGKCSQIQNPKSEIPNLADKRRGGGFARFDRAFHEALPVGEVFTGEEDLAVRAREDRTNTKPLSGFVERVGAVGERIALPRV